MTQALSKSLSLPEFLALPETKPAREYIEGEIFEKPMPKGKHSLLQTQLTAVLNAALMSRKIALALSELRCSFGSRSTIPDIAVFEWSRLPYDDRGEIANAFEIAPDWTIEILSPEQSQTRVTKNILHCLQNGTQMGWLIDPEEQTVLVFLPPDQVKVFEIKDKLLPMPRFAADVKLTVEELFAWLSVR